MAPLHCRHCPRPGLACSGLAIPRFCDLVDPANPGRRPEYLAALDPAVAGIDPAAAAEPPAPLPLAVALEAARRGLLNCPDAEPAACSCEAAVQCRRLGRLVTLRDCAACLGLTLTDPSPPPQ